MSRLFRVGYSMPIVWIDHQIKLFTCFLKRMNQLHRVGHMDIVVYLAVDDHQPAAEVFAAATAELVLYPSGFNCGVDMYRSV